MNYILTVPASEMNSWKINDCDLPQRVIRVMAENSIHSVADLSRLSQDELLQFETLGQSSVKAIEAFQGRLKALKEGGLKTSDLTDWLTSCLKEEYLEVLTLRYGLYRSDHDAKRGYFSLQEIANRSGRTRERIRQVENQATKALRSQIAWTGLSLFAGLAVEFLREQNSSCCWVDFSTLPKPAWIGSFSTAPALLLLAKLFPDILHAERHYISLIPNALRAQIIEKTKQCLANQPTAQNPEQLTEQLTESFRTETRPRQETTQLIAVALRHDPAVLPFRDGTLQDLKQGLPQRCREILNSTGQHALHFREITALLNEQLLPSRQIGAGIVLKSLDASNAERVLHGLYRA